MQELATLASIVAALSVGVISPGPSFVMVARVAVASSRIRALATALGMGVGGTIFGAAALVGLQSVLLAVPALYAALRVVGGLYLCYLGFLIFRSARQPLVATPDSGKGSRRTRSSSKASPAFISTPPAEKPRSARPTGATHGLVVERRAGQAQ